MKPRELFNIHLDQFYMYKPQQHKARFLFVKEIVLLNTWLAPCTVLYSTVLRKYINFQGKKKKYV